MASRQLQIARKIQTDATGYTLWYDRRVHKGRHRTRISRGLRSSRAEANLKKPFTAGDLLAAHTPQMQPKTRISTLQLGTSFLENGITLDRVWGAPSGRRSKRTFTWVMEMVEARYNMARLYLTRERAGTRSLHHGFIATGVGKRATAGMLSSAILFGRSTAASLPGS
jgi:hypothetical protein